MAYLDKDGVSYLWGKVKALFNKGITGISIKDKTITYTKGDGTTGTFNVPTGTTPEVMTGATSDAAGKGGLVPAPGTGYTNYVLLGNGRWDKLQCDVVSTTDSCLLIYSGKSYGELFRVSLPVDQTNSPSLISSTNLQKIQSLSNITSITTNELDSICV